MGVQRILEHGEPHTATEKVQLGFMTLAVITAALGTAATVLTLGVGGQVLLWLYVIDRFKAADYITVFFMGSLGVILFAFQGVGVCEIIEKLPKRSRVKI